MRQLRLGDLLLRAQVVGESQLNAALAEQKQWGGRLGSILVRMGVLSEDLLVKALARQLNLPRAAIGPGDPIEVPAAVLARVDRATCEKALILPIAWVAERRSVVVAAADPLNVVALDDFSRRIGVRIELMLAGETHIMQAMGRVFGRAPNVDSRVTAQDNGVSFVDNSGRVIPQRPATGGSPVPMTSPPAFTQPSQPFTQPPQPFTQPPQPFTQPPQPFTQPPRTFTQPPQAVAQPATGFTGPPRPGWAPQPGAAWSAPPPTGPSMAPAPVGADDLRALADQQLRAMRALVELLIERGIISRAELQAWMGGR